MGTKAIKRVKPIDFHWEIADPFLFCAYHNDFYPEGNDPVHTGKGRFAKHADGRVEEAE